MTYQVEIFTQARDAYNNAHKMLWDRYMPKITDPSIDPKSYWPTYQAQANWWNDLGIKLLPEVPADSTFDDYSPPDRTHMEFSSEKDFILFLLQWSGKK
jgi:hypothetical protein